MQLKIYFVVTVLFFSSLRVLGEEVPELAAIPTPAPESVTNITAIKIFADEKKKPVVMKFRRPYFYCVESDDHTLIDNGKVCVILDHKCKTAFTSDSLDQFHALEKEPLFFASFNAVRELKKLGKYPAPELNEPGFVFGRTKPRYGSGSILQKISVESGVVSEISKYRKAETEPAECRITYNYSEIPLTDFDREIPEDYRRQPHIYFKPENAEKIVERLSGMKTKEEVICLATDSIHFYSSGFRYSISKVKYPLYSSIIDRDRSVFDNGEAQTVLYHEKKTFFTAPSANKSNKWPSTEDMAWTFINRAFMTPDLNARIDPPHDITEKVYGQLGFVTSDCTTRYSKSLSIYDPESGLVLSRVSLSANSSTDHCYIRMESGSFTELTEKDFIADVPENYKKEDSAHISGTVFDPVGKPVPDCDVWADREKQIITRKLISNEAPEAFYHTTTDKDGKFLLPLPISVSTFPSNNNITVKAMPKNQTELVAWTIIRNVRNTPKSPRKQTIPPHNGEIIADSMRRILSVENVELFLDRSFTLSGHVTGYDNKPVKGFKLELKARVIDRYNYLGEFAGHVLVGPQEVLTDENGDYCFTGLPRLQNSWNSKYEIKFDKEQYLVHDTRIKGEIDAQACKKDFTAFQRGAQVTIRTVDKNGNPVSGLRVSGYPKPLEIRGGMQISPLLAFPTEKKGEYRIEKAAISKQFKISCNSDYFAHCILSHEKYSAEKKNFIGYKRSSAEIDTSTGEKEYMIELVVESNVRTMKTIVKDRDGAPVPDCQVRFILGQHGDGQEMVMLPFCGLTDKNGVTVFKFIPEENFNQVMVSPIPETRLFPAELHERIRLAAADEKRKQLQKATEKIEFNNNDKEFTVEITLGDKQNPKSFARVLTESTDPDVF